MIALATTSRGASSASSCWPIMKRSPRRVDQQAALAAYGLADQRKLAARTGPEIEHGRMELDEFDVAKPRSGAQRGRDTVTGGHRRVGGHRIDLPDAAGRQHHGPSVHCADPAARALAKNMQGDPGDCRRLARTDLGRNQVEDQRVLDDLDAVVRGDRVDQCPLDLCAGGIAAGMGDPVPEMPALAGQRQGAGCVAVELRAPGDQFGHLIRAFADQHPDRLLDAETGAGDQGVGDVLFDRVALGLHRGDAALGPVGGTGGDLVLGHHDDPAEWPALQRRGQPGDPGSHDDHVGLAHPPRRFGGQPLRQGRQPRQLREGGGRPERLGHGVGHHGAMLSYGPTGA